MIKFEKGMILEEYYKVEHVTRCYVWISYPSNNTRYTLKLAKHCETDRESLYIDDKLLYAM